MYNISFKLHPRSSVARIIQRSSIEDQNIPLLLDSSSMHSLVSVFIILRVEYCNAELAGLPASRLAPNAIRRGSSRVNYRRGQPHWQRCAVNALAADRLSKTLQIVIVTNCCVEVSSRRRLRYSSHRRLVVHLPAKTYVFGERSFAAGGEVQVYETTCRTMSSRHRI